MPDVILQRASGGGFGVLPAPPGSANATGASAWTVTTAADVVPSDTNLDGFVDILLRGLSSAVGGGVLDRILYAPGRRRSQVILNAVDDELKNFLSEVGSWTQDPNYFEGFKKDRMYNIYVRFRTCFRSRDLSKRYCRWHPEFSYASAYEEYTNLSDEAREFAEQFSLVDGRIKPDLPLGDSSARNLNRILEDVLGVEVFDGKLEQSCPATQTIIAFDQFEIWCDNVKAFGRMIIDLITGTDRQVKDAP